MKRLVADPAKCTGCGVCEEICSKAYYKAADKAKSAIRVSADAEGGYTIAVCDQCGSCRDMCFMLSLETAENGVVRLDKKTCVGCLICVAECPRGCMFYHDDHPTPIKCVACGLCAKQCPEGALKVES